MTAEPSQPELLRSFVASRDVPCPVCRYNLRGVAGEACPECGARLELRVGSIDLKLGPWILCVLAASVPLGFNGILAVIATLAARAQTGWGRRDWIQLGALWGLTALYGLALYVLSRRRARFIRRRPGAQWRRATLLALTSGVIVAASVWFVFRYL